MSQPYTLWAIPGFLGLPSDWSSLALAHLKGVDLFAFPWDSFSDWAQQFNAFVKQCQSCKPILMGYSLGGRLALHALVQSPTLWQAAIIVSTHPGLESLSLKQERWLQDQKWARCFREDPWEQVLKQWNEQEVFSQDSFHFVRKEKDYQRSQVADLLVKASLGQQDDLREAIQELALPLLWVVGEKDVRYRQVARGLTFKHPFSSQIVISQAGHRAPWEQSLAFRQAVQQFICQTTL